MSTINSSYQTATRFAMAINSKGFESFSARITDFQIPNISTTPLIQSTPFQDAKHPGSNLTFDPLTVTAIADGGLSNAIMIFNWLVTNPENCITCDLSVIGYASNETPVFTVRFEEAFPTNLAIDQFTTTDQSDTILKFNVTFDYTKYIFL